MHPGQYREEEEEEERLSTCDIDSIMLTVIAIIGTEKPRIAKAEEHSWRHEIESGHGRRRSGIRQ